MFTTHKQSGTRTHFHANWKEKGWQKSMAGPGRKRLPQKREFSCGILPQKSPGLNTQWEWDVGWGRGAWVREWRPTEWPNSVLGEQSRGDTLALMHYISCSSSGRPLCVEVLVPLDFGLWQPTNSMWRLQTHVTALARKWPALYRNEFARIVSRPVVIVNISTYHALNGKTVSTIVFAAAIYRSTVFVRHSFVRGGWDVWISAAKMKSPFECNWPCPYSHKRTVGYTLSHLSE